MVSRIPRADVFQLPFGAPYGSPFGIIDRWHKNAHRGADFIQPGGAPIHSAAWGRVIAVYPLSSSPVLGNVTVIASRLASGRIVYLGYCHQSRVVVKRGDKISRGQLIGYVGETGSAAVGNHLHLTASYEPDGVFYGPVFDVRSFVDAHDSLPKGVRIYRK